MTDHGITRQSVSKMRETEFREQIIMPLMQAMGYKGVYEYHGPTERGKDIVCWKDDELGGRCNYGVVAKVGPIGGSNKTGEVAGQIRQALNDPYADPHNGTEQRIHRTIVMTNARVPSTGRTQILAHLDHNQRPFVAIGDIDDLWPDIETHLASPHQALLRAERLLSKQEALSEVEVTVRSRKTEDGNVTQHRRVRFALDQTRTDSTALSGNVGLVFPESDAAQQKREEYVQSQRTGKSVQIPSEYVRLDLPDAVKDAAHDLVGLSFDQPFVLELGSVAEERDIPVLVELTDESGTTIELPYLQWRLIRSGSEERVFSNAHQQVPVHTTYTANFAEGKGTMTFTLEEGEYTTAVVRDFLRLQKLYSGRCRIKVYFWNLGVYLSSSEKKSEDEEFHEQDFLDLLEDLAEVQLKTNQPIIIPARTITEDEWSTIAQLRRMVHGGEVVDSVQDVRLTFLAKDIEGALDALDTMSENGFRMEQTAVIELFGARLNLGRQTIMVPTSTIANRQELVDAASAVDPDKSLEVRLVPVDDHEIVQRYLDWYTGEDASTGDS